MSEKGHLGKKAEFRIVRDYAAIPPLVDNTNDATNRSDNPLSPDTHSSILDQFQRLGFLGNNITSYTDLIAWHSFKREYELGGMKPDRIVGRGTTLRRVSEEDGVRTEIDYVVYNAHYRKADPLEGDQRPKAKMLLLIWPEPRDVLKVDELVRVDVDVTDAGEVRYKVDPRVTVIRDNQKRTTDFQNEVDRWGFHVQLQQGINDQTGVLFELGGQKFAEQLKKFDEKTAVS